MVRKRNVWSSLEWLSAGLCLAGALATLSLWFLFLPGIVMLLRAIDRTRTLRAAILGGIMVGILGALGAVSWFWYAYPVSWLDAESGIGQISVIAVYWLNVAFYIGVGFSVLTATLFLLKTRWGMRAYLLTPILWLFTEVLCSFIFSILSFGPGAYPNANFSFHYLGYLVAHIDVLYPLIAVGGVYALSFFSALLGTILFYLHTKEYRWRAFAILLVVSVGIFPLLSLMRIMPATPTPESISIITIDTKFSNTPDSFDGWSDRYTALGSAIATALTRSADIILLPEDARLTTAFASSDDMLEELREAYRFSENVIVVDSARIAQKDGTSILRAYYYDLGQNEVYTIDKQYLVPQGEFVPYMAMLFMRSVGLGTLLSSIEQNQNYRPGPVSDYKEFPADVPGILFCFEGVSPTKLRSIATHRERSIALYPISHAWFHEPTELTRKIDTMLRVQALWTKTSVVSAANKATGKLYRSDGTIEVGIPVAEDTLWTIREYNL